MLYDLDEVESVCTQHGLSVEKAGAPELRIRLLVDDSVRLIVANDEQEMDSYIGFDDVASHSHGDGMLTTGSGVYLEYDPASLIRARLRQEVLVFVTTEEGQVTARWFVHRENPLDLSRLGEHECIAVKPVTPPSCLRQGGSV